MENNENLTPKQIVECLDQYIIGQNKAKRAVAVALRNRTRRLRLEESIRDEVAPKNILMIGPTGSGKTEIARRLAKLCNAPFIKVEATKYTEVGYVGRDVESMVRDLMAVGFKNVKAEMEEELREKSVSIVEEKLLDLLLPGSGKKLRLLQKVSFLQKVIIQPAKNSVRCFVKESLKTGRLRLLFQEILALEWKLLPAVQLMNFSLQCRILWECFLKDAISEELFL